jgi:hypothetical protein
LGYGSRGIAGPDGVPRNLNELGSGLDVANLAMRRPWPVRRLGVLAVAQGMMPNTGDRAMDSLAPGDFLDRQTALRLAIESSANGSGLTGVDLVKRAQMFLDFMMAGSSPAAAASSAPEPHETLR